MTMKVAEAAFFTGSTPYRRLSLTANRHSQVSDIATARTPRG